MLGKLLKYEVKATARSFLPIYLAIILFALMNRFINPFVQVENTATASVEVFGFLDFLRMVSVFVYFALIVAVIAMTLVIIIQRFYKNLLSDEGYLMFTLPVKPWQHIISKFLVSIMWFLLSFVVIFCSVLVLIRIENLFSQIGEALKVANGFFGTNFMILTPIFALISAGYFVMSVYNALSIGHLFIKHRILASFGAYIGIYIINQIVFATFILISSKAIFLPLMESLGPVPPSSNLSILMISLMVIYGLLGGANFISANIILNKKLNLE